MEKLATKKIIGLEKLKIHELNIKKYEMLLREQAKCLEPHAEEIAKQWSQLYLDTFGRSSFFSPERVEKVHRDMVSMFIDYLNNGQLELYLERLSSKGSLFASLGVPFEEIIISVHLFEESCLPILLQYYQDRSRLYPILIALEELHHSGLVVLASSYFFNIKRKLEYDSILIEEENKKLKDNLSKLTNSYFLYTKKELGSMRLLISSINNRLKERVIHLNEINSLNKLLQNEFELSKVITLALSEFCKSIPRKAIVAFLLFNENEEKLLLFSNDPLHNLDLNGPNLGNEISIKEIPMEFMDLIFNRTKPLLRNNLDNMPSLLAKAPNLRIAKNFLIFPIKDHNKPIGFLLVGSLVEGNFPKEEVKFYSELAETIVFAIQRTILFHNLKNHVDFLRSLDKLNVSLLKSTSMTNILDIGIDTILQVLNVDRCSIMLIDENSSELYVCLAKGINATPFGNLRLKIGEGIAGRAIESKEPIQVAAVKTDHHFIPPQNGSLYYSHIKSILCVPLKMEDKTFGVINIASISKYRTFSKDEIDMLVDIAERISIALIRFSNEHINKNTF